MSWIFLKFILGSVILLFSTQVLVSYTKKISVSLKISPLIIGLTIVAIGTSLPELSLSMTAIYKHDVNLAMGNIVGSNIINIIFVFAIGIIIGNLRVGTSKTQRNAIFLLISTAIFAVLQIANISPQTSGIILISLAIAVTLIEYYMGVSGRDNEDKKMFVKNQKISVGSSILIVPFFLVIGVVIGSLIAVSSIEEFAKLTSISTTIIGLSLTAIVTSLPELFTTIFSQKKHQAKLTLGNILGSNIYNILLIGGFVNLLYGKDDINIKDWTILLGSTLFFIILLKKYNGKIIPKKYGVILLIFFAIYLASLKYL